MTGSRSPPSPPPSSSPSSSKSPLRNVNFACYVLRHVRVDTLRDVIKCAQINDAFRDALESWSPTFWRRLAAHLVSQPHLDNYVDPGSTRVGAFFKHDAFAWAAENLLTVGQLDVSRMEEHPLYIAAECGAVDVVRLCVAVDPSCIDVRKRYGQTALHRASFRGHTECVRELIAAGADITATARYGWTALHRAADQGHADIVRMLVAHADFEKIRDVRNSHGWTAMNLALTEEVMKLLTSA